MRKRDKNKKYRTHPLIKAAFAMTLMLTLSVCVAAYGFYRYMRSEDERIEGLCGEYVYEAYISLSENLDSGNNAGAVDALSRLALFSGCGELESLRRAILEERLDSGVLNIIRSADSSAASITDALLRADGICRRGEKPSHRVEDQNNAGVNEWERLRGQLAVTEDSAHALAVHFVGVGAALSSAENHSFPLVYTFVCENAAVDVTRIGGELLRMYVYRHGGAEERDEETCRKSAEKFLKDAGVGDCTFVSCESTRDGYRYLYCGTFLMDGELIVCPEETVDVGVASHGAAVNFFNAFEYYRNKPVEYGVKNADLDRIRAEHKSDENGGRHLTVYRQGKLFSEADG